MSLRTDKQDEGIVVCGICRGSHSLEALAHYMDDDTREAHHAACIETDAQAWWGAYCCEYPDHAQQACECSPTVA